MTSVLTEKDTLTLFSKFESKQTHVIEINKYDTLIVLIGKIADYNNIKSEFIIKNCNIRCGGKYISVNDLYKQIKDLNNISDIATIYTEISVHKMHVSKPADVLGKSIATTLIKEHISKFPVIFSFGSFNISEKDIDKNIKQQFHPNMINSFSTKEVVLILVDLEFGVSNYSRQFYDYISFIKDGLDDFLFPYHRNLVKFPNKITKYVNYTIKNNKKEIINLKRLSNDSICIEYENMFNKLINSSDIYLTIYCLNWNFPKTVVKDIVNIDPAFSNNLFLLNWDGHSL